MFHSLHRKLVLILLLLITSLMTVVGVFLVTGVAGFFMDRFYRQVEDVFGDSSPSNAAFVASLYREADNGAQKLQEILAAKAGDLGIDSHTRNYYILDRHGQYLTGSDGRDSFSALPVTPNLLSACASVAEGRGEVFSRGDITADYMDVAIPILSGENAYIIYLYDNRDTVDELNRQLFIIILQALCVGLLISLLLSFLLSKTMTSSLRQLTAGSKRVAQGDFSHPIRVTSTDEIGVLTETFNDMAVVLRDTLETVENERNKLDTLFLHMTDGVVAFASDGSILTSNPAASSMLGREVSFYDYDALLGETFPLSQVLALTRPHFLSGELTVGEHILELYIAPISDEKNGGIMAVLHDVTAQRKNEAMRKEFVANVSHELRTPLTNVRSYAETLRDTEDIPTDIRLHFLDTIINETDRMTHIVQDLLTLSRLDSGKAEMNMRRFSFREAMESVLNAVELEAKRHEHTLIRAYGGTLPMMTGDRGRIEQVMMNVLSNAIKYTLDGGVITVDAGVSDGNVWMDVSDTGIGIPPKDRERIFDRFYRVDKARSRESGGTGLGLSIAREIMDRHHGSISLPPHEGPGTTVRISLPLRQPEEQEARYE